MPTWADPLFVRYADGFFLWIDPRGAKESFLAVERIAMGGRNAVEIDLGH